MTAAAESPATSETATIETSADEPAPAPKRRTTRKKVEAAD
jgi:hypothetical protein